MHQFNVYAHLDVSIDTYFANRTTVEPPMTVVKDYESKWYERKARKCVVKLTWFRNCNRHVM